MLNITAKSKYSWVHLLGPFEETTDGLIFRGVDTPEPQPEQAEQAAPPDKRQGGKPKPKPEKKPPEIKASIGQSICNQRFTEGRISVQIEFAKVDPRSVAEIILQYDPVTEDMLTIGLGGGWNNFFSLRQWTTEDSQTQTSQTPTPRPKQWRYLRAAGDRRNLKPNKPYNLEVVVQGSVMTLTVDGVVVGGGIAPYQFTGQQTGIFCISGSDVIIRNFTVESARPQAFVVMQFNTTEYEDLYNDVIAPVCDKMGLKAFRASETYSPGLVIADITKQIAQSRVIIAEITPINANVYYEVGFADALGKPLILIADRKITELPFDIRPYRTIFYENSIGGKSRVEETLTKYLSSIMGQRP
jgi:hypothetical protein